MSKLISKTERIIEGPLTHEGRTNEIRTEWVPSVVGKVRSTWRDPVGKKLTNARILFYQRQGKYGEEAKVKAIANHVDRDGFVHRCECGSIDCNYFRWGYLPKPGYYCLVCRDKYRQERDKEKQLKQRIIREYV